MHPVQDAQDPKADVEPLVVSVVLPGCTGKKVVVPFPSRDFAAVPPAGWRWVSAKVLRKTGVDLFVGIAMQGKNRVCRP